MSEKKIIVREDGLYKNGKKLQLEYGNLEQIAAIRSYEKKLKDYKAGIAPTFTYEVEATASFQCLCDQILSKEKDVSHEGDEEDFEDDIVTCHSCERKYEFVAERYYEYVNGRRKVMSSYINVKLK